MGEARTREELLLEYGADCYDVLRELVDALERERPRYSSTDVRMLIRIARIGALPNYESAAGKADSE